MRRSLNVERRLLASAASMSCALTESLRCFSSSAQASLDALLAINRLSSCVIPGGRVFICPGSMEPWRLLEGWILCSSFHSSTSIASSLRKLLKNVCSFTAVDSRTLSALSRPAMLVVTRYKNKRNSQMLGKILRFRGGPLRLAIDRRLFFIPRKTNSEVSATFKL